MTGDPRLVCLGNFTVDDVILPGGIERPGCIGGDALYAGLAARLFEPLTEIAAPIGSDLPDPVRQALAQAGFSPAALPVRPLPTLRNRVVYGANGSRVWTLYASEAEFEALSPAPADLPESYRRTPSFLVLAMALPAQERLVNWMRAETNARVALDPQEDYIAGNVARIEAMLAKVDIFMPSAEEVRLLTGGEDWRTAARHFAALGPRIVVVKLGAEGVIVHDAERDLFTSVPAYPAAPVDTTGAGDAFCGGFAAAMLSDHADLARAARYGGVAASFAIAGYGASGILSATKAEAQRRLSEWLLA